MARNSGSTSTIVTANENATVTIETSRLILRAATDADVDGLHECFSDSVVMKYWSSPPHQKEADTSNWISKMKESKRNGVTDFVIILKTDDSRPCIGKVGVWADNEVGFIIARRYWKQGFASEAVSAVLDHFFGLHISDIGVAERLNSIWGSPEQYPSDITADVDPRNDASLRILGKLGFEVYETKEKTLQVGDEWVDSVYLSLKKDVWLQRRKVFTS